MMMSHSMFLPIPMPADQATVIKRKCVSNNHPTIYTCVRLK